MKFLWITICIAVAVMATVDAASVKNKNTNKSCPSICTADYTPVCAADPGDQTSTPRLFGNKCVLSVHNCEHNSNLVQVDMNKCKKTGGIRLS